ncbi:hypothetical protein C8R45DRAFT_923249 [Mycena sanguinolenta]|nr:hypothetical protein C8R45DRAFT_923249 [Mycena sanguinolenta]
MDALLSSAEGNFLVLRRFSSLDVEVITELVKKGKENAIEQLPDSSEWGSFGGREVGEYMQCNSKESTLTVKVKGSGRHTGHIRRVFGVAEEHLSGGAAKLQRRSDRRRKQDIAQTRKDEGIVSGFKQARAGEEGEDETLTSTQESKHVANDVLGQKNTEEELTRLISQEKHTSHAVRARRRRSPVQHPLTVLPHRLSQRPLDYSKIAQPSLCWVFPTMGIEHFHVSKAGAAFRHGIAASSKAKRDSTTPDASCVTGSFYSDPALGSSVPASSRLSVLWATQLSCLQPARSDAFGKHCPAGEMFFPVAQGYMHKDMYAIRTDIRLVPHRRDASGRQIRAREEIRIPRANSKSG